MGCFALKRKPCGVIAHVIDQDIEPEEWAEVYEALKSAHILQTPPLLNDSEQNNGPQVPQQGFLHRRRSSHYQAMRPEEDVSGEQLGFQDHDAVPTRAEGCSLSPPEDKGVRLRMSNARGVCMKRKGQVEVFAFESVEADPLLELETFGWTKDAGLRLRNARSGKLLMTLVPIKRPSAQRVAALPQECQLPSIGSEELAGTWELCRIYADGRVVASVRCSPEEDPPPPSCWHNMGFRRGSRRQTFRVWVAARGAVEAACSRCHSFKTDSSEHELSWALRGLGVSGFAKPGGIGTDNSLGVRNRSEVQREVADYWKDVASAQRGWTERHLKEGRASTEAGSQTEVVLRIQRKQSLGDRHWRIAETEPGPALSQGLAETSTVKGDEGPTGSAAVSSCESTEESSVAQRGLETGTEGALHAPQRSLDSVDEFFECRSGRNSDSSPEASLQGVREGSSKSLVLDMDRLENATPETGAAGIRGGASSASHHRSRSADFLERSVSRDDVSFGSSKQPPLGETQAGSTRPAEVQVEKPPLRRFGMLESFLSMQTGAQETELERPLLSYRSSGLEFDPMSDVRPLEPQGSTRSVPSAFITSAMVPLTAELTRASLGKVEIDFRNARSDVRLGESPVASARGLGFSFGRRLMLDVSASCPVDTLALVMLTKYLRDMVDSGSI